MKTNRMSTKTMRRPPTGPLAAAGLMVMALGAAAGAQDETAAVLEAQDRRFAATVAGDVGALERMLTDDMTYTHSTAAVDSRAEFLAALGSGRVDYEKIAPGKRDVRVYGDAAVVDGTCHVLVKVGERDVDVRLRFTELYVRKDGAWRMALWHSTRIP